MRPGLMTFLVLPLVVLSCDGEGGRDYCETCNLDEQIPAIAAEGATDCGSVGINEDPSTVVACIEQALADGAPFTARQELQGIDSTVMLAWATDDSGVVQRLSYDSNICGGGNGCDRMCGPRVSMVECGSARIGAFPNQALVDCDDGDFTTLCEPPE